MGIRTTSWRHRRCISIWICWDGMIHGYGFYNWFYQLDSWHQLWLVCCALNHCMTLSNALPILFPSQNKHTNKLEISTIHYRFTYESYFYTHREKLVLDRFKSVSALIKDYYTSKIKQFELYDWNTENVIWRYDNFSVLFECDL